MKKQIQQILLGVCVFSSIVMLNGCSTLDNDMDKTGRGRKNPVVTESNASGPHAPGAQSSAVDPNADIQGANRLAADSAADKRFAAPHAQVFHFAFDDITLQDEDKPLLQAQGAYLKNHPKSSILLAGHTDERGSREYNVALGERRAQTVAEYLRLMGVAPNQIRLVSYGQEKPAVVGHEETVYAQNRRVALDYEATA